MASGRVGAAKHDEKYAGVRNYFGNPEKNAAELERIEKWKNKKLPPLYQRDCLKCGAPLHFAKTNDGKTIPLDLRAPVYAIVYEKSDAHDNTIVVGTELAYVTHFSTCPFANEFGQKNREEKP